MTFSLIFFSLIGFLLIIWFYFKGKALDKDSEAILKRIFDLENDSKNN